MAAPPPPHREPDDRIEAVMYAVAAMAIIGLGVWLRTPVLNWIVGPAIVVTLVTLGTPAVGRLARRAKR